MSDFVHIRHKPPADLERPRELVIACAPFRSHVNLSRIVRTAGCCGVTRIVACGRPKLDPEIARDAAQVVQIETHRTLPPALRELRAAGFRLVGLEQTTGSVCLYEYRFERRTALIVGNERQGLEDDVLALLDDAVEIPVYGRPFSYNVSSATDMALYEYCRQFRTG